MARLRGDVIRRNAEIARRNDRCFEAWRDKRLAGIVSYADAWPPVYRTLVDEWFAERRDLALRWLFKVRVARCSGVLRPEWAKIYPRMLRPRFVKVYPR